MRAVIGVSGRAGRAARIAMQAGKPNWNMAFDFSMSRGVLLVAAAATNLRFMDRGWHRYTSSRIICPSLRILSGRPSEV